MIIGFDAKRAFNNQSGLGNYSRTLITSMARAFPEQHYVLFTPTIRLKFDPIAANIAIKKPKSILPAWYWRSFQLTKEQQKAGLNVFHGLSNELPFGAPPKGIKQVVTIHDLIFLKYPQYYPFIDRKIYEVKVKHSCEVADVIIAVSEQTKRDIAEWMPAVAHKIEVVYQSCDERYQKTVSQEELQRVKSKFNLPEKYLLYVGAIAERKNILNLVKAYAQIAKDTDAHLVLAGNGGEYKARVKSLVQEVGLQNRVHCIEQFETEDLPALYRLAELFVYPSEYEGFGIPIIEALWTGVPVITTEGGCFPEAGGPDTYYVDTLSIEELAEAMLDVISYEPLREKMIAGGKEYVQRFRNEVVLRRLMEVYTGFRMEIKFMKQVEDNLRINSLNREGLNLTEIEELEKIYNQSRPFPRALRELLYLSGSCDNTGIINEALDYLQKQARKSLEATGNEINRPFFAFHHNSDCEQFVFIYLDENSENPNTYIATPCDTDKGEPLIKPNEFTLSGLINEALHRAKHNLSW